MTRWLIHTYWPEVRGNVYAIGPCAIVAYFWATSKHRALQRAHAAHRAKLELILRHLDPEADTDGLLDLIADRTNEKTPGGVRAVLDAVSKTRTDSQGA